MTLFFSQIESIFDTSAFNLKLCANYYENALLIYSYLRK